MKKTNKTLMALFLFIIIALSTFVIKSVNGFKPTFYNLKNVNIENASCYEFDGYFNVYIDNENDWLKTGQTPWTDLSKDIFSLERNGDTVRIKIRNGVPYAPLMTNKNIYIRSDKIKYIRASNETVVRCNNVSVYNIEMTVDGRSGIFINANKTIQSAKISIKNYGIVAIDSCKEINADLSNWARLRMKMSNGAIIGSTRNTSFIELTGKNNNIMNLVRKDSSAIIHYDSKTARNIY